MTYHKYCQYVHAFKLTKTPGIGLVQTALEYYEEAAKINSNYFTALFKKGVCIHDLEKKNYSSEFKQQMKQRLEKRFIEDVKNTIQKLEKIPVKDKRLRRYEVKKVRFLVVKDNIWR